MNCLSPVYDRGRELMVSSRGPCRLEDTLMQARTNVAVALFGGMNLNKAIRAAADLGCDINCVRRTGEIRVGHKLMEATCGVNRRRGSAPRHLVVYLRRVLEAQGRGSE